MRLYLIGLSICTVLITVGFFAVVIGKGEDYYEALVMAPDQVREDIASRRKGLGQRISAMVFRVRNRKSTALVDRIMAGSGQVFAASPRTAQDMLHLRRMAAARLTVDPQWVRLDPGLAPGVLAMVRKGDGIDLGPAAAELSALDAARVFWENAQSVYDAEGRAKLRRQDRDRRLFSLEEPTFEAKLRAHRTGCEFLTAGLLLGMKHDAKKFAGEDCADATPGRYRCHASAVEVVGRSSRESLDTDAVPCAELERVAAGNPSSLQDFRPRWSIPECIRQARLITSAPGWRSSATLCAEEEAKVKASGAFFIRPMLH